MAVTNDNIESRSVCAVSKIFDQWSVNNKALLYAKSSLRTGDKEQSFDGQIVIYNKSNQESLRFFVQIKGTTKKHFGFPPDKYKKLLMDVKSHKMPVFLFVVYLDEALETKKIQFAFLNERLGDEKFSIKICETINDCNDEVEKIIKISRHYYFYNLTSRFVGDIPIEIQKEVDNYNNFLDQKFCSVKKAIYPDVWKFCIFYDLQRKMFGRAPIPYGYSSSLIQQIPPDNHFWQYVCDRYGDFKWDQDNKISTYLLQQDLELCLKNKLFDLTSLNDVPRFGRIHGKNINVRDNYAEQIFLYLAKHFENSYGKFCQQNFPFLNDYLKLNSCTILSPKVRKPEMPVFGWDDSWIIRKNDTNNERIIVSNKYDSIKFDLEKQKIAFGIPYSKIYVALYCSEDILIDSIYQTLAYKLKKLRYISDGFCLHFKGIEFE